MVKAIKGLMAMGGLGLALLLGQAQSAKAEETGRPAQAVEVQASYYAVNGPYLTYLAALYRAEELVASGYYVQIVYRWGYWYVVFV